MPKHFLRDDDLDQQQAEVASLAAAIQAPLAWLLERP
jgi:hypothetical protein